MALSTSQNRKMIIVRPRVTEKASVVSEAGVYTFEVGDDATKSEIAKSIIEAYKVTPVRINITRNPGKKVTYKGRIGRTKGVKKAYVYLKKGDKIDLV